MRPRPNGSVCVSAVEAKQVIMTLLKGTIAAFPPSCRAQVWSPMTLSMSVSTTRSEFQFLGLNFSSCRTTSVIKSVCCSSMKSPSSWLWTTRERLFWWLSEEHCLSRQALIFFPCIVCKVWCFRLAPEETMVSFDVTSPFTCIPTSEALKPPQKKD